jgi:hypothetical protein
MKRTLSIVLVLVVALIGYALWPVYGLNKLRAAVQSRDSQALDQLVDYPLLRRSLTDQIVQAYLKVTGQGERLGGFGGQIAAGIGATIADPIVDKFLNSKALIELFTSGRVSAAAPGGADLSLSAVNLESAFGGAWDLFKNSEYGGRIYSISLPADASPEKRVRLRLRFSDWEWKLSGVRLPDEVTLRLAQELQKTAAAR